MNISKYIIFILTSTFFSIYDVRSQGRATAVYQPVVYYINAQLLKPNAPEISLRLYQYLMQAYAEKFCSRHQSFNEYSTSVSYENVEQLQTAIKNDFPHLINDEQTGESIYATSLYKRILFRIYPTVSTFSSDPSERNRLEDQNIRYSKILYGYQLLMEKVLPEYHSEAASFPLAPQLIQKIRESFLLTLKESAAVKISAQPATSSRLMSACFPWNDRYAVNIYSMLNYLEGLLLQTSDQINVCSEIASFLDVLIYSQISALSTKLTPSLQDVPYCPQVPFLSKIQF